MTGFAGKFITTEATGLLSAILHTAEGDTEASIHPEMGICFRLKGGTRTSAVWNAAGTLGLVLVGEVFPSQVVQSPEYLRSILDGYEKSGLRILETLNGWFSGIILDRLAAKSVLFNDRYGLGRVYVYEGEQGVHFSTVARSLLERIPESRYIDERGLAEWLSCGSVLQDRSLFKGIKLLPAGSAWIFTAHGDLKKESYFEQSEWEKQTELSPREYEEELERVFPRQLKTYIQGEQRVGMSLTGGIDGKMVMAWAGAAPGELPCYTFNGPYRECADARLARKVAKACGQTHTTIQVGAEFFRRYAELAEECVVASDGAMDVTGAAEIYVNRLAKVIAPVRLTGNYGSEILRGHVAFKPRNVPGNIWAERLNEQFKAAAETYLKEKAGHQLSFIAFKQVPWHHYSRFAVERAEIAVRSPFLDNALVGLAFRAPQETRTELDSSMRLIAKGRPSLAKIPTDRGITFPANRRTHIRRSVQEFLAKAEYAYDYGMPDWLARVDRLLGPLNLERCFLGRQKFCHFRTWYRTSLAGFVKDVLLDAKARTRWWVDGKRMESIVAAHISGQRNYTTEIHKLLSLELIQRKVLS
jgi:asparagine synthase (glutamine-hydrolysing)